MDPESPEELASLASEGGRWSEAAEAADTAEAAEAAAEAAEEAAEEAAGEPASLVGALFHTDPDVDPRDVSGPRPIGEFVVGLQKVFHARGVDVGEGSGTPAILNFARSAIGFSRLFRSSDPGGSEGDVDGDRDGGRDVDGDRVDGDRNLPDTVGPRR